MLDSVFAQVFLPISIFIIMAGIGMTLVWDDFRRVLVYPKAVFIGVVCQLILLPLLGFAIATSFNLSPEYAVGIMLLAACPGGTTSNLISHLARADTALSITLTSITSMITVVSIPVIVSASIGYFMAENQSIQLPVMQSIGALLGLTVLPVALGMLLRAKRPEFAKAQQSRVNVFAMILMGVLVAAIVYQERVVLINEVGSAGLPAISLNVSSMLLGFALARIVGSMPIRLPPSPWKSGSKTLPLRYWSR